MPRKNIVDLAGKPLIAWTIFASLNSKYISKTIVSSDDVEILCISERFGAEAVQRPDDLAGDCASSESVVRHIIDYLEYKDEEFDLIVLLQPTSPLRTYDDIDNALEIMFEYNNTAVISVCAYDNKILKSFLINDNGSMQGVCNNVYPFMRRQELPPVYMANGAIYIIYVDLFKKFNSFFTKNTGAYIMPEDKSVDIDDIFDLELVRGLLLNS